MDENLQVGQSVVYVDPVGKRHAALVTEVWTPTCINLVFVSSDENRKDTFGRQIERSTSLMHMSVVPVHGNYWRRAYELAKDTEVD